MRKLLLTILFFILIIIHQSGVSFANTEEVMSFEDLWHAMETKSMPLKSIDAELESTNIAHNRSARHWYPQIYMDAKSYYTNDPGLTLFSKLGERAISGQDFNPSIMNFPIYDRHEKIAFGAQWVLFAGGASTAQVHGYEKAVDAKENQKLASRVAEYSKTIAYYGELIALKRKTQALEPLKKIIDTTISRYEFGSQSNPLGHSGLLGLKNIKNRLSGELDMIGAQEKAIHLSLVELAEVSEFWKPKFSDLTEFLNRYVDKGLVSQNTSFSAQAQRSAGQSMDHFANAEYAHFLPQVGLFAERDYYNNTNTNFANSNMIGLFIKWDLFNATNFGAVGQAKKSAEALDFQADAIMKQQRADYKKDLEASAALVRQIKLADESLALLEEQSDVTKKLFTNGLVNVLQLLEVYGRRVEVIDARTQMEEKLIQTKAEMINFIPFAI